jgi:hypothetical protein
MGHPIAAKVEEKNKLDDDVQAFLEKGGEIKTLKFGIHSKDWGSGNKNDVCFTLEGSRGRK